MAEQQGDHAATDDLSSARGPAHATPLDRHADVSSDAFRRIYYGVRGFREFIGALLIVLVPLGVAMAAALFLYAPEQTKELYRYLFESLLIALSSDLNSLAAMLDVLPFITPPSYDATVAGGFTAPGESGRLIYLQVLLAMLGVALMSVCLRNATEHAIGRLNFISGRYASGAARTLLIMAPYIAGLAPALAAIAGVWRALEVDPGQLNAAAEILDQLPFVSPDAQSLAETGRFLAGGVLTMVLAMAALIGVGVGWWWLVGDYARRRRARRVGRIDDDMAAEHGGAREFFALALCLSLYLFANWLFGAHEMLAQAIATPVYGGDVAAVDKAAQTAWLLLFSAPLAILLSVVGVIASARIRPYAMRVFLVASLVMVFGWIVLFAWPMFVESAAAPGAWRLSLTFAAIAVVTLGDLGGQRSVSLAYRRFNGFLAIAACASGFVAAMLAGLFAFSGADAAFLLALGVMSLIALAYIVSIFAPAMRRPLSIGAQILVTVTALGVAGFFFVQEGAGTGLIVALVIVAVAGGAYLLGLAISLILNFPWRVRTITHASRAAIAEALGEQPMASQESADIKREAWGRGERVGLYIVFTITVASLILYPVAVPQTVGALALFAVFICLLCLILTQLRIWGVRLGVPLIAHAVVAAVLFSALDLNDNHQARRVDALGRITQLDVQGERTPTMSDLCKGGAPFADGQDCGADRAFAQWLRNRADLEDYRKTGESYPVFIVAAQGGGIYAAAHTVSFLTQAQALCPRFAQHVFAISGVSGGSVGAAIYGSLAKHHARNLSADDARCPLKLVSPEVAAKTGQKIEIGEARAQAIAMRALGREAVAQDFLSPLFGAAFFPDFLQRFLPAPFPAMSRARALERAFEESWTSAHRIVGVAPPERVIGDGGKVAVNPLSEGFLQLWDPAGAAPALILNTTEAESGRRRVISPFRFGDGRGSDLRFAPLRRGYDMPLSTAASLSARFPWLTPAGWFWDDVGDAGAVSSDAKRRIRVVDGGYYENSGVATAIELIEDLQPGILKQPESVDIRLIVLTRGGFVEVSAAALGEVMSPIRAMLGTREARTHVEIARAIQEIDGAAELAGLGAQFSFGKTQQPKFQGEVQRVEVDSFFTALPLGWTLSRYAIQQIAAMAGHPQSCLSRKQADRAEGEASELAAAGSPIASGSCAQQQIYQRLGFEFDAVRPEDPPIFGEIELSAGFEVDPVLVRLQAGGTVNARSISRDCAGSMGAAPDVTITHAGGPLTLTAEPTNQTDFPSDLKLIVRNPSGDFICNDDLDTFNPGILQPAAAPGVYRVWVAAEGPDARAEANLWITGGPEPIFSDTVAFEPEPVVELPPIDPAAAPLLGEVTISESDPTVRMKALITSGFALPVGDEIYCTGEAAEVPTVSLNVAGGPLAIWARYSGDATLAVLTPSGGWLCNDDASGFNPAVTLPDAAPGAYKIWVGSLTQDSPQATLVASSILEPFEDRGALQGGGFAANPANVTEVDLSASGAASVSGVIGGDFNARRLEVAGCAGWISPDRAVRVSNVASPRQITLTSPSDATLVAQGPDGEWHCGDDGAGLDAQLVLPETRDGSYLVWFGSYAGDAAPAELTFTAWFGDEDTDDFGEAEIEATLRALEIDGAPVYGRRSLARGFGSEPITAWVRAGGDVAASNLPEATEVSGVLNAEHCSGWIGRRPDLNLDFEGGPIAVAVRGGVDTTLIVLDPDGAWICNDDARELNAGLGWRNAKPGLYRIWVGSYEPGVASAFVSFSEPAKPLTSAAPEHGELRLSSANGDAPLIAQVRSGGSISASVLSDQCAGAIGRRPDLSLDFVGDALSIAAISAEEDLTLAVYGPNGDWWCNDDAHQAFVDLDSGVNAGLGWRDAPNGEYQIFVGALNGSEPRDATVIIKRDATPEFPRGMFE